MTTAVLALGVRAGLWLTLTAADESTGATAGGATNEAARTCATPQPHALTLTAGTGGSLSASPAGHSYAKGTSFTVTATAEDGYKLSSWGDDCADTPTTSAACSLTMNANKTVSATFTLMESEPLSLLVVSNGAHDSLLLEWSGPADATGWQYRQRHWIRHDPQPWGAWTDIPGGANVRSYRVTGLSGKTPYDYQLRAVVGSTPGEPSEIEENGTQEQGSAVPRMYLAKVVEGDGRTRWQQAGFTIVIPDGVRVELGSPAIAADGPCDAWTPLYIADRSGGIAFHRSGNVCWYWPEVASPVSGASAAARATPAR